MAKSEHVEEFHDEEEAFDQEALLEENLEAVPEEQDLRGFWQLQWVGAKVKAGHGDKGPWSMINVSLDPITPVGEDADQLADEYDLEDLPRCYHRIFYTTNRDKRAFIAFAKLFGVETGKLKDMLEEARGQFVVAKLSKGKDNFGRLETKLSSFRAV